VSTTGEGAATPWLAQPGFEVRLGWGPQGIEALAPHVRAIVLVDVLRFTTALDVAVALGAQVAPAPWPYRHDQTPAGVEVADGGGPRRLSLSPGSLAGLGAADAIVLPSLNGSHCSALASAHAVAVVGASLRNASAVAQWLLNAGPGLPVAVIACGERWPDGSLRPGSEDLLGAGAVVQALRTARHGLTCSSEARSAADSYGAAAGDLALALADSVSGRELITKGLGPDLEWAAAPDVSRCAPLLSAEGVYQNAAGPA
jgi:2-phosphosulfolactate phosphatase